MSRFLLKISLPFIAILSCAESLSAQQRDSDVFYPIARFLSVGDVQSLSACFSNNIEISIFSSSNTTSKSQATQIIKSFFNLYSPRKFEITHEAGRSNMRYALGTLTAGGEVFLVTIFISEKDGKYKIQQLKIERL